MVNRKKQTDSTKIKEIGLDKLEIGAGIKLIEEFMKADPKTQRMIGKLLKKKKGGLVRKK